MRYFFHKKSAIQRRGSFKKALGITIKIYNDQNI